MIADRKERILKNPHESKIYSEFSHFYEKIFSPFFEKRIHGVIEDLHIPPGAKVLEVGIGTGLSMAAYPPHCEVTGVDLAADMLERARQKAEDNDWRHFHLLEMDALNLKFSDNTFDYVTSFHVISVVPDPVRMMQEIHRVCKPQGNIAIINHFRTTKPLLGPIVRALTPVTRHLGWDASLQLSQAFADVPLRIQKRFKTSPFSLFTVVLAENQKNGRSGKEVVSVRV
ncbi:MAG: methyltransferase domain-containing protein [Deltaproteobacteria bacterium]|nr:methyltransferase domain-containing protein [Deltaproteobacteria bacterium]